jgi:hypothetical protein
VTLTRDGDPELVHIEETDANFTIEWKGHYRIEGDAFIDVERGSQDRRDQSHPRIPHAEVGASRAQQLKFQIFLASLTAFTTLALSLPAAAQDYKVTGQFGWFGVGKATELEKDHILWVGEFARVRSRIRPGGRGLCREPVAP